MSKPITKDDLDQAVTMLRGETKQLRDDMEIMGGQLRTEVGQLRTEMKTMGGQLRADMGAMETRLVHQIDQSTSKAANVMVEHLRGLVSVVDEKYKDLPRQHAELRAEFDEHAADSHLHRRSPPTPGKRVRRS